MNRGTRIFLILLRIAVGWHFLYEGVTKLTVDPWLKPFTSEPYLQASIGPFRGAFRGLISDKDGLARLNKESIDAAMDQRYQEILDHYKGTKPFSDAQTTTLKGVVNDLKASLAAKLDDPEYEQRLAGTEQQLVDTEERLLDAGLSQQERARLAKVRGELKAALASAVGRPATLWEPKAPTREELQTIVEQAAEESRFRQRVTDYQMMLARADRDEPKLTAPFSSERLTADRVKLNKSRAELLVIATAPLAELDAAAQKLADVQQMLAGPLPAQPSQTGIIDWLTAWGLTAIGLCLVLGFFTTFANLGAAAFLATFYFAMPPWPGLPEPSMIEGHYLFVNKNLVEMFAVLALATLPTGHWFGLDRWAEPRLARPLLRRLFSERSGDSAQIAGARLQVAGGK